MRRSGAVTLALLGGLMACGGGSSATSSTSDGDAGGSSSSSGGAIGRLDRTGYDGSVCTGDGASRRYEPLTGVAGLPPFDSLELRSSRDPRSCDAGAACYEVGPMIGSPCATATNADACKATYASLTPPNAWSDTNPGAAPWCSGAAAPPPPSTYFVATRGDEVKAISNRKELAAFLGPIDTPKKAALMLFGALTGSCAPFKQTADGYAFYFEQRDCCGSVTSEATFEVLRDGTVRQGSASGPFTVAYCPPAA